MKVGDYVKLPYQFPKKSGWFFYKILEIRDDGLRVEGVSYRTGISIKNMDKLVPMTEEDIKYYTSEIERIAENRRKTEERQDKLLEKIDLTRSDFCRFRDIYENEGGTLIVCTRENGVNGFSLNAAKSPLLITRRNDEFDSTYAYYDFHPLEQQAIEGKT